MTRTLIVLLATSLLVATPARAQDKPSNLFILTGTPDPYTPPK